MSFFLPGYNFGYRIVQIDDHPWDALVTMKEILRLEPGSIVFTGPNVEPHRNFWRAEQPALFEEGKAPVFIVDTQIVHPHKVETEPRTPFRTAKDDR